MLAKVGKITRLFGQGGEVSVNLFDTFPSELNTKEPLYIVIDMLTVPLFIERFERKGRSGAIIEFADIDNPERAAELLSREIFLPMTEVGHPEERLDGELYFDDLTGYSAILEIEGGKTLRGTVAEFIDSEFNPLLVVDCDGREVMIPANDEMITALDTDSRTIEFLLPEGLVDLNPQ